MNIPLYNIFIRLIRIANYKVDSDLVKKMLLTHPSYPSLEALSETLSFFNIPHEVYTTNYENLINLKDEATLLHLQRGEGRFVILLNINENGVTIYDADINKTEFIERKSFLDIWSSATLSVKRANFSKRDVLKRALNDIKIGWILIFFIGLLFFIRLLLFGDEYLLLLLVNLLGISVVSFIVLHELNLKNKIVDEVCKKKKHIDCDAVLSSSASKLFGIILLGDIGIVYFTGGFLYCLLLPLTNVPQSYLLTIFYLSVCTLPYTFFSFFYQKFKLKKWCPFCLTTTFLLWIIFSCYSIYVDKYEFIAIENIYYPFFLFGFISLLWFSLKSKISSERGKMIEEINYLRLKRNPTILSALFANQKSIEMDFKQEEIIFGNFSSTLIITTLISEKCKYCKELLKIMINLVESNNYDFKWIIRFDGIYDKIWIEKNARFPIHFLSLYQNDNKQIIQSLKDWCEDANYERWMKTYPFPISHCNIKVFMDNLIWVNKFQFLKIPLVFINNKVLPSVYKISDLSILLSTDDSLKVLCEI